jgi:hypothetical protein
VNCWAKVFSILAVILLALSISPTGELFNENDSWITRQIKWMKKFDKSYSYPVTINPILLWLGVLSGIAGIFLS